MNLYSSKLTANRLTGPIPILSGITKTLSHGNSYSVCQFIQLKYLERKDEPNHTSKPPSIHFVNHGLSKDLRGPLMHIMCQCYRTAGIQPVSESLYTGLNPSFRLIRPVKSVNVGVDDMISQLSHGLEDKIVIGKVRWPHVRGVIAKDLLQSRLEEIHLVDDIITVESGKVGMRPAIR